MPFVYEVKVNGELVETLPWGCGCGCIMAAYEYARDVQWPAMLKKYDGPGKKVEMERVFQSREE